MHETPPPTAGASKRRLFAILGVIILFSEIATFEILMVYPAVPHIAEEFETLDVAWVISIVTLAGATLMPLIGKLADKVGKKRVIMALTVVFVLGCLISAVAPTFVLLLVGRAAQGALVGIVALSYSLVRDIMPRDFVPIALGVVATGIGMSAVAGPFIAGWLIDGFGFRSVFWFLAIYVAALIPLYAAVVPESPVRADRPVDYLGTALLGPGVAVLLIGVSKGSAWGWSSTTTLALLTVGVLMLVLFVARQRTATHPLIDFTILFGRRFGPTVLAVACVGYMMNAHALMMPTLLQTPAGIPGISYGAGLSATTYALWTCALGLCAMLAGPVGGYCARRFGPRQVLLASGALFVLVMFLGAGMPTSLAQVVLISALAGVAVGFLHSSNANLVQEALPSEQSGVGSTIAGVGMQLTSAVSVTVTGAVMAGHLGDAGSGGRSVMYADSAFGYGFGSAALVGAVGIVIAVSMKHGRSPAAGGLRTPEETAVAHHAERV
ncbi:MFS transporter [Nocardia speluncae]|nr:MFS transporter [Nocardia speluncae]